MTFMAMLAIKRTIAVRMSLMRFPFLFGRWRVCEDGRESRSLLQRPAILLSASRHSTFTGRAEKGLRNRRPFFYVKVSGTIMRFSWEVLVMAGRKVIDERGKVYGRLRVLSRAGKLGTQIAWNCLCDPAYGGCGEQRVVGGHNLRNGKYINRCCPKVKPQPPARSRVPRTKLYRAWLNLRGRCRNPNHPEYSRHGGRGITVCPEWSDFTVFRDWASANGHGPGLELARRDKDGNYCPENCEWITRKQNNRQNRGGKCRCRRVELGGVTYTLPECSEKFALKLVTIKARLRYGWSLEAACLTPARQYTRKELK